MVVIHGDIEFASYSPISLLNISSDVKKWVEKNDCKDGILTIFCSHTTAGIIINEDESGLIRDIVDYLKKLVPFKAEYRHDKVDDNTHAHIKASIIGHSETIIVRDGRLALGTWQNILFVECDGPRRRKVLLTFIGET